MDDEDVFLPDGDENEDASTTSRVAARCVRSASHDSAVDNNLTSFVIFSSNPWQKMQQQQQQPRRTKIYYASRTHSQLSQVVPELRRLNRRFHQLTSNSLVTTSDLAPSGLSSRKRALEETEDDEDDTVASVGRPQTRVVALGSRRQLCINDDLRAKGGNLDERCRELLNGKRCSIPFATALCCGSPCGDGLARSSVVFLPLFARSNETVGEACPRYRCWLSPVDRENLLKVYV